MRSRLRTWSARPLFGKNASGVFDRNMYSCLFALGDGELHALSPRRHVSDFEPYGHLFAILATSHPYQPRTSPPAPVTGRPTAVRARKVGVTSVDAAVTPVGERTSRTFSVSFEVALAPVATHGIENWPGVFVYGQSHGEKRVPHPRRPGDHKQIPLPRVTAADISIPSLAGLILTPCRILRRPRPLRRGPRRSTSPRPNRMRPSRIFRPSLVQAAPNKRTTIVKAEQRTSRRTILLVARTHFSLLKVSPAASCMWSREGEMERSVRS